MTDLCSCGHDLDEHQRHYGTCKATIPGTFEPLYRYCPCGGFERDNPEAV